MHTTRLQQIIVMTTVLLSVTVLVASAAGSGPPAADLYFPNSSGTNNGAGLFVYSSCLPSCTPVNVTYMKWNFTARPIVPESATVNFARLTLDTTTNVTGTGGNVTFELRKGSTDSWTEASTAEPGYDATAGGLLDTQTVSLTDGAAGQTVVFQSANLVSFVEGQRTKNSGDNVVTLAVRITAGPGFAPVVEFKDREAGSPQLLLTSTDSNAVTLTTFRLTDPTPNWPLIAGGAALLALAVVVFILRRRAAVRA